LKLPESQIQEIYLGTIVHDVGKIGIKDDILNKKGPLTAEEYTHIQEHPVIGKNLLSQLKIAPVAVNITYYHQERWDGSGYPTGMRGKAIPQEARIAAIADFWDAITTDRPYREAMPLVEALAVIKAQRGKGLDPELLDIFLDPGDRIFMRYLPPEKRSPLE
ncbi:MAG: HD domain-containing protein, partial [Desulfobacterales bacterium]|nr:HD domain-containing protein [Desulfobacterales bacterium]